MNAFRYSNLTWIVLILSLAFNSIGCIQPERSIYKFIERLIFMLEENNTLQSQRDIDQ